MLRQNSMKYNDVVERIDCAETLLKVV